MKIKRFNENKDSKEKILDKRTFYEIYYFDGNNFSSTGDYFDNLKDAAIKLFFRNKSKPGKPLPGEFFIIKNQPHLITEENSPYLKRYMNELRMKEDVKKYNI